MTSLLEKCVAICPAPLRGAGARCRRAWGHEGLHIAARDGVGTSSWPEALTKERCPPTISEAGRRILERAASTESGVPVDGRGQQASAERLDRLGLGRFAAKRKRFYISAYGREVLA